MTFLFIVVSLIKSMIYPGLINIKLFQFTVALKVELK